MIIIIISDDVFSLTVMSTFFTSLRKAQFYPPTDFTAYTENHYEFNEPCVITSSEIKKKKL